MSTKTMLDKFIPRGQPIHPFDYYEIVRHLTVAELKECVEYEVSPPAEDQADYVRNIHKEGASLKAGGRLYFVSTSVEPKTKELV